MSGWDEPSANETQTWVAPAPVSQDAAMPQQVQADEFNNSSFVSMDAGMGRSNGLPPPPRRPREYEPDPAPTMTSDEAWAALVAANEEKDLDDFKVFFLEYVRNNKELTFVDLEKRFRDEGLSVYLIAMEKDIPQQKTIRDLQGNTGKKYLVSFQLGPKNRRTRATKGQVASTPEENLERLGDAGFLVEDLIPVCFNCNAKGHGRSECPHPIEERVRASPIVCCINCGEEGHRMRDCPRERRDVTYGGTCRLCDEVGHLAKDCPTKPPLTCRNCGEEGHHSKGCENPPNLDLLTCHGCGGAGHRKADCPEKPKFTCSNCDQEGHKRVDCREPPNMDKVQCKECDEMGHYARDCPNKKCRNCSKPGHHSRECPEPFNPKNIECRNCLQKGHFSRDCPEPRVDANRVCYTCKSPDHMSRDCPMGIEGQGRRRTERDTLTGNRVISNTFESPWEPAAGPIVDNSGGWN